MSVYLLWQEVCPPPPESRVSKRNVAPDYLKQTTLTLGCFAFHPANNDIFDKMLKAGLCSKRSGLYVL